MEFWRAIDTGLRSAAQNIAMSRALLEARQAEEIPSTLRFLRFAPSALLGYHQSPQQEFNLDYCDAEKIAVQRRITGGVSVYVDSSHIGWELYLHRRDLGGSDMRAVSRRICHAAATAISALGLNARYRSRDEIEVQGRRISSTAGMFEGNALLFQGTLCVDCDIERMLRVLRTPVKKPSNEATAWARERVAGLRELLGRQADVDLIRRYMREAFESEFSVEFRDGDVTLSEHARYQTSLAEIDNAGWVNLVSRPASDMPLLEAAQRFDGRLLRATVALDNVVRVVRQVWFSVDAPVGPQRTIVDLEAALRDTPVALLEARVRSFFVGREIGAVSPLPDAVLAVLRLAVRRPLAAKSP